MELEQIKDWIEKEIESTYAQMKQVEQTVEELRVKYNGWKYINSGEYQSIPAYFRKLLWAGETYQRERIAKDVKAHFAMLQGKVEKRIGEIKEIIAHGSDEYLFKGTKGEVGIRVIFAGGWNIQRFHTRWVFDRRA